MKKARIVLLAAMLTLGGMAFVVPASADTIPPICIITCGK